MPGEADLTAHVDFAALARTAREAGAAAHGPLPQGTFLSRLGIEMRAARLLQGATPAQARDIRTALARLLGPGEMGTLFKVLAIAAPSLPVPPGFDHPPQQRS
jgi:NADH dehydrogenase [ubiquinone] 1 alpha subcomplex assembly factor 7